MSAVKLHPDFAKALGAGIADATAIERDAKRLAASLKAMHGGEWSIKIDHRDSFVLIRWFHIGELTRPSGPGNP